VRVLCLREEAGRGGGGGGGCFFFFFGKREGQQEEGEVESECERAKERKRQPSMICCPIPSLHRVLTSRLNASGKIRESPESRASCFLPRGALEEAGACFMRRRGVCRCSIGKARSLACSKKKSVPSMASVFTFFSLFFLSLFSPRF